MSSIYLKATIETLSIFLVSKTCHQFCLGSSNSRKYHWILKSFVATYKSGVWEQNCVQLFYDFKFERSYDILKSKSSCILLNKNINFHKKERNQKWEIPHTFLERRTLCFSSYKNRKLKEKKREGIFCTIILSKVIFFMICVLSQCILYWIHFQNIRTFTYQNHYFIHFCCLFLKSSKTFCVSLNDLV